MNRFPSCALVAALLATVALAPPAGAVFTGTDVFLPSVGARPGVPPAVWYTTIWVHNPNATAANVTFYLLERQENLSPRTYTDTIPAGDTRRYDNAVKTMFGVEVFGAIRVTSNVKVMVGSRIYSQPGTRLEDSMGQFFAGVPASFAIGTGESTELTGVWQTKPDADSLFRYNFGFVEVTGTGEATVQVQVKSATGALLGSRSYTVRRWEQMQKGFKDEFPSIDTSNARLTIAVTGGTGRVIAFGSQVAQGSTDPSTFEMLFKDPLLAENSSGGGTITGVTAGAGLTGGGTSGNVTLAVANSGITSTMIQDGAVATADLADNAVTSVKIADGTVGTNDLTNNAVTSAKIADGAVTTGDIANAAVTREKLSASGGSNGQVLKLAGGSLAWDTDLQGGLTLPFSGSGSSANALFRVDNNGGGSAIYGESSAIYGVHGESSSPANAGVRGGNSSSGYGVYGVSTGGTGVHGFSHATSGIGVLGIANLGALAKGVYGRSDAGTGVLGESGASAPAVRAANSSSGPGVHGSSTSGAGVEAEGKYGVNASGSVYGLYARETTTGNFGYVGHGSYGVYGKKSSNNAAGAFGYLNYGVWGDNGSGTHAGYFSGNVQVAGTLTKSSGSFKIDHPLEPEKKYLYHSFVESPDMMNIYNGNTVTDERGFATVRLPEWFEALNRDFRYQLTVLGGGDDWVHVRIARKIANNSFVIQTSAPHTEVSWQVTGIRQDAWANAHRTPVEEDKPADEQGTYLHPEVWGQPEERGVEYRLAELDRRHSETASAAQR